VRELRNRLSHYLVRVRAGEHITVTDRGEEIAVLAPSPQQATHRRLAQLAAAGFLRWNGAKPAVPPQRVRGRGRPLSEVVIEDRR
jgi:prevent-host-death family protein